MGKIRYFHDVRPALRHAAHNRLVCIGGVKVAAVNSVSFDAIIHANTTSTENKGRLELKARELILPACLGPSS